MTAPGALPPRWAARLPYTYRRIFDPAIYQGGGKRDGYFEGWYFKMVGPGGANPLAVIPGVSHDAKGRTSHSFVQIVRPGGLNHYVSYPLSAFSFSRQRFEVSVGPNRFSSSGMTLAVDEGDVALRGEVFFGEWSPWPVTVTAPGIMGWYRYVPRMECYHGVLSLDHTLRGGLEYREGEAAAERLRFDGGRGYVEKDWGSSFPSSWVWAQSNHFEVPGTSVTFSVAKIPWLGSSFVGCIAGILHEGRLYRFATYTGAEVRHLATAGTTASCTFADGRRELDVRVDSARPAALKAPRHGVMVARAEESLDATISVRLFELDARATATDTDRAVGAGRGGENRRLIFEGVGRHAAVEVMDSRGELTGD